MIMKITAKNPLSGVYLLVPVILFLLFLPGPSDASVMLKIPPQDDRDDDLSGRAGLEKHLPVSMDRVSGYGHESMFGTPSGGYPFDAGTDSSRLELQEWILMGRESLYFSSGLQWTNGFSIKGPAKSEKDIQAAVHDLFSEGEIRNIAFENITDESFNPSLLVLAFNEASASDAVEGVGYFVLMQGMGMEIQRNGGMKSVPEPGSLFLLGAGLVILAGICRKAIAHVRVSQEDVQS